MIFFKKFVSPCYNPSQMRKYEYTFGELLIFLSPVLIALFMYSYREGSICRQFRIKPMLEEIYYGIEYLSDTELHGVYDYWQYPEETVESGQGDCEDVAMLLASRIIDRTGLPAGIVTGDGRDDITHAWVYFKNRYYDPTFNRIVRLSEYQREFKNINYLPYDKAMYRCSKDAASYFQDVHYAEY